MHLVALLRIRSVHVATLKAGYVTELSLLP